MIDPIQTPVQTSTTQIPNLLPAPSRKWWIWVVVVIIIVAALAFAFYLYYSGVLIQKEAEIPVAAGVDEIIQLEGDLNATAVENLDTELSDIDKELVK